jgi:uncharacterized membrane protein YqjE
MSVFSAKPAVTSLPKGAQDALRRDAFSIYRMPANVARLYARDFDVTAEGRVPMAGTVTRHAPGYRATEQSVGELVSLAATDISQLVRCEIELAKAELKNDVRRVGIGGALLGVAAFVGCLVLVLLCIAFAFGLHALGIWTWAAFLIVAGTCVLLAALAVLIGWTKVRKLNGLRRTRRTVSDDLTLLRRDEGAADGAAAKAR